MSSESVTSESSVGEDGVQRTDESGESGLDENVAGALAYLLGVLTGVVVYLIEPDNEFVRFHAAQSIVLFGGVIVASVVLSVLGTAVTALTFSGGTGGFFAGSIVSLVLGLVWLGLFLGSFVAWLYLMVAAYQGKSPRVPVVAGIADRIA